MPLELRKMVFTGDELMPVIRDYCLDNSIHMPTTKVQSVDVSPGPPISIALTFPGSDANGNFVLEMDKNRLLAAFVRACKVMRIPLPKHEEKHLKVDDKGIALVFGLQTKFYK